MSICLIILHDIMVPQETVWSWRLMSSHILASKTNEGNVPIANTDIRESSLGSYDVVKDSRAVYCIHIAPTECFRTSSK